ncbi:MAG: hypothetical protein ABSB71_02205 [Candidatus Bathyarchaeia archaeon]
MSKTNEIKFHPNWLRFMYAYTIVGAGVIGLALLIVPNTMMSLLGIPTEEPIIAGMAYSVWLAFGILSIFGLRSPLKFVPVLLLQFTYKVVWFIAVIAPKAVSGDLPSFAITMSAIFVTFVIGDIIVIPWRYLLSK